ncbi:MAG TPA: ClbS/DfsB family four-helix bundle protein [Anaerolineales bacterium]|nr:ClbS/DfsB family four-helix bundle protein [Anaerolineales bacterium]
MNKSEVLSALEESREKFLDAIEGLPEEAMEEPGVVGEWSVKDILVHLTRWEAELVKLLWQARNKRTPTSAHFSPSPVDELNERWYRESHDRPLQAVLEDFHGVRNQTIRRVEQLPEQAFEDLKFYSWLGDQALWKWIAEDSFAHETEHEEQVRIWRSRKEG